MAIVTDDKRKSEATWTAWAQARLALLASEVGRRLSSMARVQRHAPVDYRDRISVATWLVVIGLGGSLLVELPSVVLHAWAFGSPISIPFTGVVWFVLFLAALAAAGTQSVISVHPSLSGHHGAGRLATWPFWALPMALVSIAAVMVPLAPGRVIQVLGLIVSGTVIALAYSGLYATVDTGVAGSRRARLLLDTLAYSSGLLLFLFVYQTRTRSLLSGTLIALIATLLSLEILRTAAPRPITALLYSGIVGLILGQVTWALNYWVLPGITGGLLLLLIFYLLIGIAQQGLQERLTRRVLVEFGIFALVALVLIAWVGPGLS